MSTTTKSNHPLADLCLPVEQLYAEDHIYQLVSSQKLIQAIPTLEHYIPQVLFMHSNQPELTNLYLQAMLLKHQNQNLDLTQPLQKLHLTAEQFSKLDQYIAVIPKWVYPPQTKALKMTTPPDCHPVVEPIYQFAQLLDMPASGTYAQDYMDDQQYTIFMQSQKPETSQFKKHLVTRIFETLHNQYATNNPVYSKRYFLRTETDLALYSLQGSSRITETQLNTVQDLLYAENVLTRKEHLMDYRPLKFIRFLLASRRYFCFEFYRVSLHRVWSSNNPSLFSEIDYSKPEKITQQLFHNLDNMRQDFELEVTYDRQKFHELTTGKITAQQAAETTLSADLDAYPANNLTVTLPMCTATTNAVALLFSLASQLPKYTMYHSYLAKDFKTLQQNLEQPTMTVSSVL
jgi:hypothetical protein